MRRAPAGSTARLLDLARLYPVQTTYRNILTGGRTRARDEAIGAVLRELGAQFETPADLPGAIRARRAELWSRVVPPVVVAWEGRRAAVDLRLPDRAGPRRLAFELVLESGARRLWRRAVDDLPVRDGARVDGTRYVTRRVDLPPGLPPGYHRLTVSGLRRPHQSLVVAAPRRAFGAPAEIGGPLWGAFVPLYALDAHAGWGAGSFTGLGALAGWIRSLGGSVVATLPLLSTFLDEPFEPSPYSPVSRLFWNEFYLDPTTLPEFALCPAARRLMASTGMHRTLAALRNAPLVDYRAGMVAKRRVLTLLMRRLLARPEERTELLAYARRRPPLEDYARFRAVCETRGETFRAWPARLRDGSIRPGDFDPERRLYHLYVQWRTETQVARAAHTARTSGPGLYLDLPLGTHPDGYDVWRERRLFVDGANAGAPPDGFFTRGQDWGFRPIHPERSSAQGHRHLIEVLRHHLRHAGVLRLDHVMALHRLFWVPHGLPAKDGMYVRYPAEELYAILCLESRRARAIVVGEDLGTVPPEVRRDMTRHGLQRMYVLQYEASPDARRPLPPVPACSVAALNTHDMPPFAAYWEARDVADREDLGLLDAAGAAREHRARNAVRRAIARSLGRAGTLGAAHAARAAAGTAAGTRAVLPALLRHLGASPAAVVIVNLEDLWREILPQNTPGTSDERPNWSRKLRYNFKILKRDRRILTLLAILDQSRRRSATR